jgi:hypothetical protein
MVQQPLKLPQKSSDGGSFADLAAPRVGRGAALGLRFATGIATPGAPASGGQEFRWHEPDGTNLMTRTWWQTHARRTSESRR